VPAPNGVAIMWNYFAIDIVLLSVSVGYLSVVAAASRVTSPPQVKRIALYAWPPSMRRSRV
jgi:hypothetical protein